MTALLERRSRPTAVRLTEAPNRVLLHDIDWQTYLTIADSLPERRIRITYDRGEMEIMTVSTTHERFKSLAATLIFVIAQALNRDIANFGSFTHRRPKILKALEPDCCFYIQHFPLVAGKTIIDLENDPAPDLAMEVEISRSLLNRLAILQALGVTEVWRVDPRSIRVLVLRENGYEEVDRSPSFPEIPLHEIVKWLAIGVAKGELVMARRAQSWIRSKIKKPKR